jgi:hypothetical protein
LLPAGRGESAQFASKFVQVLPLKNCHWIVGAGDPPTVVVKITCEPTFTVAPTGFVTVGAVFRLKVAGALHTLEATEFETHAISFKPLYAEVMVAAGGQEAYGNTSVVCCAVVLQVWKGAPLG